VGGGLVRGADREPAVFLLTNRPAFRVLSDASVVRVEPIAIRTAVERRPLDGVTSLRGPFERWAFPE
jgi:hypothetical protein